MPIDYFVFSSFITQFNVKCIYSLALTPGNVNIIIIDYIEVMKSLRLLRLSYISFQLCFNFNTECGPLLNSIYLY